MAPKRRINKEKTTQAADSTTDMSNRSHRKDEMIQNLRSIADARLKEMDDHLQMFLLTTPREILEMEINDIDQEEEFWNALQAIYDEQQEKENCQTVKKSENRKSQSSGIGESRRNSSSSAQQACVDTTVTSEESRDQFFCHELATVKKRRSRSCGLSVEKLSKMHKRSNSAADGNRNLQFQTPKNRELAKRLMSHKKYTVRKQLRMPAESVVNVKRFMRDGEEAISVSGSPLFIQSGSTVTEPQIMIPLPGGVVVNIEPNKVAKFKQAKQPIDPQIREQIKTLHENLGKLMSN